MIRAMRSDSLAAVEAASLPVLLTTRIEAGALL